MCDILPTFAAATPLVRKIAGQNPFHPASLPCFKAILIIVLEYRLSINFLQFIRPDPFEKHPSFPCISPAESALQIRSLMNSDPVPVVVIVFLKPVSAGCVFLLLRAFADCQRKGLRSISFLRIKVQLLSLFH